MVRVVVGEEGEEGSLEGEGETRVEEEEEEEEEGERAVRGVEEIEMKLVVVVEV